jgi:hypothetical protein
MSKPVTKDPLAALLRKQREEALEAGQHSEPESKPADSSLITPLTTPVATTVVTAVNTPIDATVDTLVIPKATNQAQYLDATHTASEQRIYSVMYRETISKGIRERHYGPSELCKKTGIRSDKTVRMAVRGLCRKLSIEVVSHGAYFPQGPRYRVYEPKDIVRRRKLAGIEIDPQTKQIASLVGTTVSTTVGTPVTGVPDGDTNNYSSTGVETTGVTPVEITGLYKERKDIGNSEVSESSSSSNDLRPGADDEAFAGFLTEFKTVVKELTGKDPTPAERERYRELAQVLLTELRIAAGRTTVSSVPSFLTEHLRRRLWKLDKRQAQAEGKELPDQPRTTNVIPEGQTCPDCNNTGWWYPNGTENGVARCKHERLITKSP